MALAVKVLGIKELTGTSAADLLLTTTVPTGKTLVVQTMRFVNKSTSASVGVTVSMVHGSTTAQVSPTNVNLAPGAMYVDNDEITLEAGDKLQAALSASGTVDCVVSGIERDV